MLNHHCWRRRRATYLPTFAVCTYGHTSLCTVLTYDVRTHVKRIYIFTYLQHTHRALLMPHTLTIYIHVYKHAHVCILYEKPSTRVSLVSFKSSPRWWCWCCYNADPPARSLCFLVLDAYSRAIQTLAQRTSENSRPFSYILTNLTLTIGYRQIAFRGPSEHGRVAVHFICRT